MVVKSGKSYFITNNHLKIILVTNFIRKFAVSYKETIYKCPNGFDF